MPKILTEQEIADNYKLIHEGVLKLLEDKNILSITVDNIVNKIGMAKGSFYKYYASKEECLYKVILLAENELFETIFSLKGKIENRRELIELSLSKLYLSDNSIALKVSPDDLENLLKKLPAEYHTVHIEKSKDYFKRTLELFDLEKSEVDMDVLSLLMYSLHYVAITHRNSAGFEKASQEIIKTIIEYIMGEKNEN